MKKRNVLKIGGIIFLFLTFMTMTFLNAQPTLRKGFALEANYFNNGATSDWIFAIAMDPDCIHYITGGYTLQERDVNNNIPFIKVALISKINPENKAIIWQKEVNLTHYESMTDQEDETQAAVENLKIINNEIVFTGTETVRESGTSIRHSLFGRLDLDGNILQAIWLDSGNEGARGNGITPLSDGGSMVAGNAYSNDSSQVRSSLVKLKSDGTIDFTFQGPEGSSFENLIEINGINSSIKYVAIGFSLKGGKGSDPDVYIVGLKSDGSIAWETSFGEIDVDSRGSNIYSDQDHSTETLEDCNGSSIIADSDREIGYDIVQDNDKLFFTAEFDIYNSYNGLGANWGNCNQGDDRLDFDLVLGKLNLNDGKIEFVKNLDRFRGDDFKPRILKQGSKLTILGEKIIPASGNNPRIGNGTLVITDLSGNAITKEFLVTGNVDCSFASTLDCDGNLIVAGNDDNHEDDYFFAKLINSCQSTVSYSGNDIVANIEINNTQYWHSSRKVKATITIENGGVLTIDDEAIIQFASAWEIVDFNELAKNNSSTVVPRIIVMPGGTLIIDHATLKGLYACDKDWMWEGIELRNGGIVTLTNEAQILDAKIGILVDQGTYNVDGNFNPSYAGGGGLISSSGDSKIENCRRGVCFAPSSNNNGSSFSNTHFLCTNGLKDDQFKTTYTNNQSSSIIYLGTKEFVSIYDIRGISFSSCEFANTRAFSFPAELRGIGISSFDAQYSISSSTTFDDLNIGVQGLGAANPTRFIRITGANEFNKNQIGVRLVGGNLHQIKSDNVFKLNPSSFVTNQFFGYNPILGVSNSGSTKIVVKDNAFDGVSSFSTSDPLKFGFITDNSNSPSFHLTNNFTKLFMGEQMQRDNTSMQLYCNEHTLFKNAWSAFGLMSNQGKCGAGQSNTLTPDDKFNVPCVANTFSHINSSATFTYFEKSNFVDNPIPNCVTTNTVTLNDNCTGDEQTGCLFTPPELTPSNVVSYKNQADGMSDGPFKDVIVSALLRYYYNNSQNEDAVTLLASLTGDNFKFDYAMLLTNAGNFTQASSVINSIPASSDEKADIVSFMNVIIGAKQNNVPLHGLNANSVNALINIADHRTLGGYAAQALLIGYYNKDFLIAIETNQGVGYRTKDAVVSSENGSLEFRPVFV